jgi:formate dehydrogenase (NADP+) beta subunit
MVDPRLRSPPTGLPGVTAALPDEDYWRTQIKCQDACPVNTDARGYIRAISAGDFAQAYLIARGPNPLASLCGRICGAPCEAACRRSDLDKPVAIRALKRFTCEQHGPEAQADGAQGMVAMLRDAAERGLPADCRGQNELLPLLQAISVGSIEPVQGRSVGIVGSGPAGLAAAHDLALLGFDVTIYEMEPVLGGMLALGVPEYRLPRSLIEAEAACIVALGVEAVTGCQVGVDVSLTELRQRHDAVIIAVGAKRSRQIPVPGADGIGVLGGVEFLREVSLGEQASLGERVVVIGGGNVAYDVGRTVLRQTSLDSARTAMREAGVHSVHLCSLESLDEMPADDVEIIEGDEEGIQRLNSLGPVEIHLEDGRVSGITMRCCLRVFDEDHRFSPIYDDDDKVTIPCDVVIMAIGQTYDISFIDAERDGIELTERGMIRCDPDTGTTSASDIFVAGDLAYGTKLMIHAVASGKAVARAVYSRLTGKVIGFEQTQLHLAIPDFEREQGYEATSRLELPTLEPGERLRSQATEVECALRADDACGEARRCLDCGINTIFDGERCILCGGCADVCPELCLRIVSVDRLLGDDVLSQAVDRQLDGHVPAEASAILKDEDRCIRCGLCAERCPSGAITMERFLFEESIRCPTD